MKLDKAIEILQLYMKGPDVIEPIDLDTAIILGIEALKRVKDNPMIAHHYLRALLPGEDPANYHPNTVQILKNLKESPLGREPKG